VLVYSISYMLYSIMGSLESRKCQILLTILCCILHVHMSVRYIICISLKGWSLVLG
jgi:hypothetical protein